MTGNFITEKALTKNCGLLVVYLQSFLVSLALSSYTIRLSRRIHDSGWIAVGASPFDGELYAFGIASPADVLRSG